MSEETMVCPNCGHDISEEARFCGACGFTLAVASPAPAMPIARAEALLRISIFSAAVGLFILGIVVGSLVYLLRYFGYYFDQVLLMSGAAGGGVAVALLLSLRFRLTGRLPSAAGMLLVFTGMFLFNVAGYFGVGAIIGYGMIGLGIGLLFPVAFWRSMTLVHPVGIAILAVAGIAALALGWNLVEVLGYRDVHILAGVVALLIGLPAVLVSPVLRATRSVD